MLHRKHESYIYVLPLKNLVDWITTRQEKNAATSKIYILRRSAQNLTYFSYMTTFNNFTLKINTSWAKKIAKSILETWNANDVIVYVWFIYFRIKN